MADTESIRATESDAGGARFEIRTRTERPAQSGRERGSPCESIQRAMDPRNGYEKTAYGRAESPDASPSRRDDPAPPGATVE